MIKYYINDFLSSIISDKSISSKSKSEIFKLISENWKSETSISKSGISIGEKLSNKSYTSENWSLFLLFLDGFLLLADGLSLPSIYIISGLLLVSALYIC